MAYPKIISHWFGKEVSVSDILVFPKFNPATGMCIGDVVRGNSGHVHEALNQAWKARDEWRRTTPAERASVIKNATRLLMSETDPARAMRSVIEETLMLETGRSRKAVLGEIAAAAGYGEYYSHHSLLSGQMIVGHEKNRKAYWQWQPPVGITALYTPFNGPFSTLAKNVFPALLCGNVVVAKGHEDVPYTSVVFGMFLKEAGLPDGVFSVLQGLGSEVGAALAADTRVSVISATVSVQTAIVLSKIGAERLAKVAIESGGKNALVICPDADCDQATTKAVQSAFGNAGQMCAAASRIILFDEVYERCRDLICEKAKSLRVGSDDTDDIPPIINERRISEIIKHVYDAEKRGARVLVGGHRCDRPGYYMEPTVLENVSPGDPISQTELFGPVTCLYRVRTMRDAIDLVNNSNFGLTSSCHTANMHTAEQFINEVEAGVVRINGHTYGVEPQNIPFGGVKNSGNGYRMQGIDAFSIYADKKFVSVDYNF